MFRYGIDYERCLQLLGGHLRACPQFFGAGAIAMAGIDWCGMCSRSVSVA